MQRLTIVGYLAKDPEIRFSPAGMMIANLSIPTSEKWKDKTTGEFREETEWHRIVFFGKQAENISKYLKKGSCIAIEGKLKTRKWNDKDTGVERSTTDVMGDTFKMFGERTTKHESSNETYESQKETPLTSNAEDDIPF